MVVILATIAMATIDYQKTINQFEKPMFAQVVNGADDGGSGNYAGIGYSIEIQGELDVEYGFVVRSAQYNLFGNEIRYVIRD